jgi:hypothetical protein
MTRNITVTLLFRIAHDTIAVNALPHQPHLPLPGITDSHSAQSE